MASSTPAWLEEQELSIADLKRQDRRAHVMDARRKVAGYLREHGWSLERIADYMDRDHTTVLNLLRPKGKPWARRVA
jgi:chromosomal replication initiation ATPase DnaA